MTRPIILRWSFGLFGVPVLLATVGCISYSASHLSLQDDLASGHFDQAIQSLSSKSKDHLLNLLEKAQFEHYAGQWTLSNEDFEEAERLSRDLLTRSLSKEALALISNDRSLDYRAAPWEMAMIPYYRAFNYLALDQPDEALVEARKAGELLKQSVDAILRQEGEKDQKKLPDTNPFLLYFSGMLYEMSGNLNDAFIDYRNALRSYEVDETREPVPQALIEDIVRTGTQLGFETEVETLQREYPDLFKALPPAPKASQAHLIVFVESGWIPHREEVRIDLPILESDPVYNLQESALRLADRVSWQPAPGIGVRYWLSLALPRMSERPSEAIHGRIRIPGDDREGSLVPLDNLDARARKTFDAGYPKILLRTIFRALLKYTASEQARKEDQNLGLLFNIAGSLSERADTRSWLTLPCRISMIRMDLPPGDYDFDLEFWNAQGSVVGGETLHQIHIAENSWTFFNRRVF